MTLVSAPECYGKSTLISSWLELIKCPTAWISPDEYDNNLGAFLSYFIAAIQSIFPQTLADTQALLNAPELAPLRYLSGSLINELNAIGEDYILVLDDYHYILETSIHDLLDEMFRHTPRVLHLVIGPRTDPTISLAELRARWHVIGNVRRELVMLRSIITIR